MAGYIPKAFGHDTGWLAVRATDPEAVMAALEFTGITAMDWEEGLETASIRWDQVFVTPPIDNWVLVVGLWAEGTGDEKSLNDIEDRILRLSEQFGEAQALATRQTVGYHHWMLARSGELVRAFAYVGERHEAVRNEGEPTPAESTLRWMALPPEEWTPDEEEVLLVAGQWSINPMKLGMRTKVRDAGYRADVPVEIIEKKEETEPENPGLFQRAFNRLRQRMGV